MNDDTISINIIDGTLLHNFFKALVKDDVICEHPKVLELAWDSITHHRPPFARPILSGLGESWGIGGWEVEK